MHFELYDSQAVLNQKVNTLVTGLKEIDQLKRSGKLSELTTVDSSSISCILCKIKCEFMNRSENF